MHFWLFHWSSRALLSLHRPQMNQTGTFLTATFRLVMAGNAQVQLITSIIAMQKWIMLLVILWFVFDKSKYLLWFLLFTLDIFLADMWDRTLNPSVTGDSCYDGSHSGWITYCVHNFEPGEDLTSKIKYSFRIFSYMTTYGKRRLKLFSWYRFDIYSVAGVPLLPCGLLQAGLPEAAAAACKLKSWREEKRKSFTLNEKCSLLEAYVKVP